MRLFKHPPARSGPDFWSWWATACDRIAVALDEGALDENVVAEISRAVRSLHTDMAWELEPGADARHALCVTPQGRADLRQIALRWLAAAPPADMTWEYHASRQPSNARVLLLEGSRFDLSDMRVISSWDASRWRTDLRLWHPHFDRLPEQLGQHAASLFLHNLLGEDDVERWIGNVNVLDTPIRGKTPDEFRAEVDQYRSLPPGDTAGRWVQGILRGPAARTVVLADAGLKRIDYPFADTHVQVAMDFDGDGQPDDASAARLSDQEDDLLARLDGIAVYAGRATKPGVRTLHFVAADTGRVRSAIQAWAKTLLPRRTTVTFAEDMNWSFRLRELGVS